MNFWKEYLGQFETRLDSHVLTLIKDDFRDVKKAHPEKFDQAFKTLLDEKKQMPFSADLLLGEIKHLTKDFDLDPQLEKAREWSKKSGEFDGDLRRRSKLCTNYLDELIGKVKAGEMTKVEAKKAFWAMASEQELQLLFRENSNLVEERFNLVEEKSGR